MKVLSICRGKAKLGWLGYNAAINRLLVRGPIKTQSLGLVNAGNPRIIDYRGFMWRMDRDPYIQIVLSSTECA
ncbi:unnamed protein product, partial [Sphenostylis stenocarpa]